MTLSLKLIVEWRLLSHFPTKMMLVRTVLGVEKIVKENLVLVVISSLLTIVVETKPRSVYYWNLCRPFRMCTVQWLESMRVTQRAHQLKIWVMSLSLD